MIDNKKRAEFAHWRKKLIEANLGVERDDSLICPLCWEEVRCDQLTVEHTVPGEVGGKETILTCFQCNSEQGSQLDAHLVQFQKLADAFKGYGALKTELNVGGHRMVANLEWNEGTKNFRVVKKATNPAACEGSQAEFAAGNVQTIDFRIFYGYSKNGFQTAVLRAAYLTLFKLLGYEYVKHEVLQVIRRRIVDTSLEMPNLASLIIEAKGFQPQIDSQHYIMPGNVNEVPFYLVMIRVRRETTSYLAAFLPVPDARSNEFFALMEQCSKEHNGETFSFKGADVFV